MVGGISEVNSLQALRATQAFKNATKISLNLPNSQVIDDAEVKVSLSQESQNTLNNSKNNIQQAENESNSKKAGYISEIKEYANKYGNIDINDEDINYAMRYGRSILVDQVG